MESTHQIKLEYFRLINKLNLSNKTSNELTQIIFVIETFAVNKLMLYAALCPQQKILLCQNINRIWVPAEYSSYNRLEKFICVLLNNKKSQCLDLSEYITSHIFQLPK